MKNLQLINLINCLLLISMVSGYSQEPREMYDISNIMSKKEFQNIAQFILSNGDRSTYCTLYNNNPHYSHKDFEIYLNPIPQKINYPGSLSINVEDYHVIVIHDWKSRHKYYDIQLRGKKVYINNIYKVDRKSYESDLLNRYIPILKSLIRNEE